MSHGAAVGPDNRRAPSMEEAPALVDERGRQRIMTDGTRAAPVRAGGHRAGRGARLPVSQHRRTEPSSSARGIEVATVLHVETPVHDLLDSINAPDHGIVVQFDERSPPRRNAIVENAACLAAFERHRRG